MQLKGYKIDNDGFYTEDYIFCEGEELQNNIITEEVKQGLYKPKWNSSKWVEGATQEYIDSLTIKIEKKPTTQDMLNAQLLQQNAYIEIQLEQQKQLNAQILLQLAGGSTNA